MKIVATHAPYSKAPLGPFLITRAHSGANIWKMMLLAFVIDRSHKLWT